MFPPKSPSILAANKIDLVAESAYAGAVARVRAPCFAAAGGHKDFRQARRRTAGVDRVASPADPRFARAEFDAGQITDLYEREIAGDLIREAALLKLRDEVPHGIAVRVDEFKERANGVTYIAATIFVERQSQKGIVIGEGGKMLKQIGTLARQEIENMGGHKVFLELRVKVEKAWRNNESVLRRLGYKLKR